MNKYYKSGLAVMMFLLSVEDIFAADESSKTLKTVMMIVLALFIIIMFSALIFFEDKPQSTTRLKTTPGYILWIKGLFMSVRDADEDPLIDHEYDGIKEFDNKVPPLLNYIMVFTVIFAVIYMLHYHVFKTGDLPSAEYSKEMRIADMQRQELIRSGAFITEETVVFDDSPDALAIGKDLYDKNCVTCHGVTGEGLVGPNLIDDYWIHGGSIQDIFRVINEGVPEKGMISWQAQLNPKQIQDVSSYIYTLHDETFKGGKEPEGDKYIRNGNIDENGTEDDGNSDE